jgi:hypothetical protein
MESKSVLVRDAVAQGTSAVPLIERASLSRRVIAWIHRHADRLFYLTTAASFLVGGAWALWNFEYQEWLKPSFLDPPSVIVFGTLQKLGEYRGFDILGYRVNIKNTADTDAAIVAFAVTANGHRYNRLEMSRGPQSDPNSDYRRYGRDDKITPLFRRVSLSVFAKTGGEDGLNLMPRDTYPVVGRFLVKKDVYNLVVLFVSVGYVKHAKPLQEPTSVTFSKNNNNNMNIVNLSSSKGDRNYESLGTQIDEIVP